MKTEDLLIEGRAGVLSVRIKGHDGMRRKAIVLVQGSNLTGQAIFDFSYAGGSGYSLMEALAQAGFVAITFAIRGYGQSAPPPDPFSVTTEAAMEDLTTVISWAAARGFARPHLLGFSWGGRIAGRYAEDHAAAIDRLVLYDPARGGGGLVLPAPTEPWWRNDARSYAEKLEPEFTDPALTAALGAYVDEHESRSPNGIRRENASPVTAVDPTRITSPTLLVYGAQAAKAAYMLGGIERADFFEQLATDDKSFVIVPRGGDFAHFQDARYRLHRVIIDFLGTA
jgi:pimeloyl-ACP methyl ester carboxylesterase